MLNNRELPPYPLEQSNVPPGTKEIMKALFPPSLSTGDKTQPSVPKDALQTRAFIFLATLGGILFLCWLVYMIARHFSHLKYPPSKNNDKKIKTKPVAKDEPSKKPPSKNKTLQRTNILEDSNDDLEMTIDEDEGADKKELSSVNNKNNKEIKNQKAIKPRNNTGYAKQINSNNNNETPSLPIAKKRTNIYWGKNLPFYDSAISSSKELGNRVFNLNLEGFYLYIHPALIDHLTNFYSTLVATLLNLCINGKVILGSSEGKNGWILLGFSTVAELKKILEKDKKEKNNDGKLYIKGKYFKKDWRIGGVVKKINSSNDVLFKINAFKEDHKTQTRWQFFPLKNNNNETGSAKEAIVSKEKPSRLK